MNWIVENWIVENWSYVLSALFGVIVAASIIVKLTPSTKDNDFMSKLIGILDKLSIAKTDNDKKLIEIAKETLEKKEGN